MSNNPTLRTPESYLDEVTFEIGGTDLLNFDYTLHRFRRESEDKETVLKIISEAMRRYKDAACEAQRQICADIYEEKCYYGQGSEEQQQDKNNILNAPTPE